MIIFLLSINNMVEINYLALLLFNIFTHRFSIPISKQSINPGAYEYFAKKVINITKS